MRPKTSIFILGFSGLMVEYDIEHHYQLMKGEMTEMNEKYYILKCMGQPSSHEKGTESIVSQLCS